MQETRTHCALLPDGVRDSAKKLEPSLEIEGSASEAKRSPNSIEWKAYTKKPQFCEKHERNQEEQDQERKEQEEQEKENQEQEENEKDERRKEQTEEEKEEENRKKEPSRIKRISSVFKTEESNLLQFECQINGKRANLLVDGGASCSFLSNSFAKELQLQTSPVKDQAELPNGTELTMGITKEPIRVQIGDHHEFIRPYVVDTSS